MEQSNKNAHGPWICASIGSKTGSNKENFMFIGAQDTKIWGIILGNTIRQRIIKMREIYIHASDRPMNRRGI
jgi:hypothetical protein